MRLTFSGVEGEYYIFSGWGRSLRFYTPLPKLDDFHGLDFDFYLLHKEGLRESDIHEFYINNDRGGKRLGWIIPVNALISSEHDYSDKDFFLKYVYVAISKGLVALQDQFEIDASLAEEDLSVSELFSESCAILVISKAQIRPRDGFSIERCLPSLLSYGYVLVGDDGVSEIRQGESKVAGRRMVMKMTAHELGEDGFIGHFINRALSRENSAQFEFFYIYQIFEYLMDKVYAYEQEEVIESLLDGYGDLQRTKDAIEKIQKSTSEKKLIGLLFEKYISPDINLTGLRQSCNCLLRELGREGGVNVNEYFYPLRNFIFHQYRDFPDKCKSELREVVTELYVVLPDILASFRIS